MHSLNRFLNGMSRCGALYRAHRLAGSGVGAYDTHYLFYLCHHAGVTQDALARALFVNKSSVTRHLSHLEEEGFVTRTPSPEDHRSLVVAPTEKALAILPQLRAVSRDWEERITAGLSAAEVEQFGSLLERVFDNARRAIAEEVEK